LCCTGNPEDQAGPADQADVEARSDVLVYTSPPLEQDVRVAGPLSAQITLSSSARDTDLVVRLADVGPDGRSFGVQEGALRLRYRNGMDQPQLLIPDEVVSVRVDMRSIAYRFAKGHRIRVHVTSSSFPRLERNLNTGAPAAASDSLVVVATNRVHHDQKLHSYLQLPVLGPTR
jgi:putative CocE/NonD family hydrolase